MEPTQLQLVLNVVTITGMTSLAGYCYLLKKENRRLATRAQKEAPKAEVVQTVVHLPSAASAAKPAATVELDIRTLASARRARWVKNLASSVS
ncbi:MAG: hypothetical protein LAP61_09605 [Acidobacteriia bacterium]|nr:hypothetical protein [Terriglobia bacterium]